MKKLFLLLCCIAFNRGSYCQDTINWRSNYQLTWDDFKAAPDTSSVQAAMTYTVIRYKTEEQSDSTVVKVYCYFQKDKSWTKAKNDSIFIKHERGHFDIAELHARLFRKAIRNMPADHAQIDSVFKKITNAKREYNAMYDRETQLSRNKEKQLYWSKKILAEIQELDEFR